MGLAEWIIDYLFSKEDPYSMCTSSSTFAGLFLLLVACLILLCPFNKYEYLFLQRFVYHEENRSDGRISKESSDQKSSLWRRFIGFIRQRQHFGTGLHQRVFQPGEIQDWVGAQTQGPNLRTKSLSRVHNKKGHGQRMDRGDPIGQKSSRCDKQTDSGKNE